MKKVVALTLAVAMAFSIASCGKAKPAGSASSSPSSSQQTPQMNTAKADADLDAMLSDPDAPISGYSVMAFKDGKLCYERTGGYQYIDPDDASKNIPFTTDTRFRTASISKVFAGIGVMRLVEAGKIDLDADVSQYLGFTLRNPNYPDTPITCRMLMSHTSSLRDGSVYSIRPEYSIQEFFTPEGKYWLDGEHFADSKDGIDRSPGVYFAYTNLNYGVLGTILERLSGQRFDEYMKSNVLEPMGLKASYNPGDFTAEELKYLSPLYQKQTNGVWDKSGPYVAQFDDYKGVVQDRNKTLVSNPDVGTDEEADLTNYVVGTNGTIFSPQGGLRISTAEMKVLIDMFFNDGKVGDKVILTPESVDTMFTPFWRYNGKDNGSTYGDLMCAYGPAIQTMTSEYLDRFVKDRKIVLSGHFGEAYGLLAGVFMDRETGTAIYYVMNGMGGPEEENYGEYSGMYKWEERFCTALLDNLFPEL